MKKLIKIMAVVSLIVLSISFVGCRQREAITEAEFIRIVTEAGFAINHRDMVFTQVSSDEGVTIEFWVFFDDEMARSAFDERAAWLDARGGAWMRRVDINASGHNIYRGTNGGMFFSLVRIDNTLLYAVTDAENRSAAEDILRELGYR
ncbi:MAG: hypothetical protein FWC95_04960 [Defluviitaleaceae bacterium]|nr:hypothetical protein [Defluviitaleaceae bacterium]